MWMKLCFAVAITFHLFCSAMCSRDMTKYELAYVLTSLLTGKIVISQRGISNAFLLSNRGNRVV